jgi:endonuclease-3
MAAKKTPKPGSPRTGLTPKLAKAPNKKARVPAAPATAAALKAKAKRSIAPGQVQATYAKLRERHSDAHCELDHQDAFQLILATVLSAQSTDVMVNKITPELFKRWPTPKALAEAEPAQVEQVLSKIGMFRQKTKNVIGLSKLLVTEHGGEVPHTLAELIRLPGVGRKTANVVLGVAFGTPEGVVVDTHVQRISQRLGWTTHTEPVEIEQDLMKLFPQSDWDMLSHTLIFHGRRVCAARKPACAACPVTKECPSAFEAEHVGRKGPSLRRRAGKPAKA